MKTSFHYFEVGEQDIATGLYLTSQSSHRKYMKTIKKKGFLPTLNAMGRSVLVKTPAAFQIANKINGFEHISYGTALI